MHTLSTAELFDVWESAIDQPLLNRMLLLLSKACKEEDVAIVAKLSVGERDARLLQLREWLFGNAMNHVTSCPSCNERIEWQTSTTDMIIQPLRSSLQPNEFEIINNDYTVRYRLVNSLDMLRLLKKDITTISLKKMLLEDCMLQVSLAGTIINTKELPTEIFDSIETAMAVQDPQADMQMQLLCPACEHQWEAGFDIMHFLWTEIHHWAQRLMQEIFLLARSFSWSEKDILRMTPRRRQLYLQMIQG